MVRRLRGQTSDVKRRGWLLAGTVVAFGGLLFGLITAGCSIGEGVTPTCEQNASDGIVESDDGCSHYAKCSDPVQCCDEAKVLADEARDRGENVNFDYFNCLQGYGVDPSAGGNGCGGGAPGGAGGAGGASGGAGGGGGTGGA